MYRKNSNPESKNILESKLLLLTDKINLMKVQENDQLKTTPLEYVTTTEGIVFSFVTLTHCSFLSLFMVKRNERETGR